MSMAGYLYALRLCVSVWAACVHLCVRARVCVSVVCVTSTGRRGPRAVQVACGVWDGAAACGKGIACEADAMHLLTVTQLSAPCNAAAYWGRVVVVALCRRVAELILLHGCCTGLAGTLQGLQQLRAPALRLHHLPAPAVQGNGSAGHPAQTYHP